MELISKNLEMCKFNQKQDGGDTYLSSDNGRKSISIKGRKLGKV